MTQDEIIRMARETGFTDHEAFEGFECSSEELERFAALVAAHEREKQAEQEPLMITPGGGAFPFAVVGEIEQAEQKPPKWYTREEIIDVLKRMNYCEQIAQELADWFVLHLQHAFNKGFQEGQREMHAPQKREWMELSDEDRAAAFNSLPDMLDGFLKKWGWLHFANEIERRCMEKQGIFKEANE